QQHHQPLAPGERREASVMVDLSDRAAKAPVGRRVAQDLASPAQAVLPALATVLEAWQQGAAHQAQSRASSAVDRRRLSAQDQPMIGSPLRASRKASRSPSPSRWR